MKGEIKEAGMQAVVEDACSAARLPDPTMH